MRSIPWLGVRRFKFNLKTLVKRIRARHPPPAIVGVGTGNSVASCPRGGGCTSFHHYMLAVTMVDNQVRFPPHEVHPRAADRHKHKKSLLTSKSQKKAPTHDRFEVYTNSGGGVYVVGKRCAQDSCRTGGEKR